MSSMYERAARELFASTDPDATTISMSFVELSGDVCSDLMNAFNPAQLLTGQDGGVYAFPIVEPEVSSDEELIAFINHGCKVRTTAATGVNDTSSRSHAILRIYISNSKNNTEGVLTLVDLAGSEHRIDSMYHSSERRKEGAGINASLMALKEVLRARACDKDASFSYRKSKLTMALKSSFSDPLARTVVIVTTSPASKDTEHSLNSLRHACVMSGKNPTAGGETRFMTGGRTTTENIGEVDVSAISRENRKNIKSGKGLSDLKTCNGNTSFGSSVASTELTKDEENKKRLRARRASERRAIASLTKEQKVSLQKARDQLGVNLRQQQRLRRSAQSSLSHPSPEQNLLAEQVTPSASHPLFDDVSNSYVDDNNVQPQKVATRGGIRLDIGVPNVQVPISAVGNTQPTANPKSKTATSTRKKVSKIRDLIFSDEYTPFAIKIKLFMAQLKKNGYSKEEVQSIIAKEEGADIDVTSSNNRMVHSPVQYDSTSHKSYQATGFGRPVTNSPPSSQNFGQNMSSRPPLVQNSPPRPHNVQDYPIGTSPQSQTQNSPHYQGDCIMTSTSSPGMSRAEAAKERRLQKEAEQQAARRKKIAQKSLNSAVTSAPTGDNSMIAQLEEQLNQPNLSAATKHAIKKKIAAHRAVLVREERKRNQDQRAAKEASRRQQQVSKKELDFSDGLESAAQSIQELKCTSTHEYTMPNTASIESMLSPRMKSVPQPSPIQKEFAGNVTQLTQPYQSSEISRPTIHQQNQFSRQEYNVHPPLVQSQQAHKPLNPDPQHTHPYWNQPQQHSQSDGGRHVPSNPHALERSNEIYHDRELYSRQYQPSMVSDSIDTLRLGAQNVIQSNDHPSFYRGHAGAEHSTSSATNVMFRSRSSGGAKGAISAAYNSPFATEYNYMNEKETHYMN